MKKPTLLFFMLSILFSCSKDDYSNANTEALSHDNVIREYILHVPTAYDSATAVPLMFNFHGYGGTAAVHQNTADMRSLADTENFILVYPQGTLLDGAPHWNAGLDTPENKSDSDDFGFIEALLEELAANYNIDRERVYACGYSNGAFFSYALACYHSDKIAAIGSVSGTMLEETYDNCNALHPMPMINLHGTSDGVVPYDGALGLTAIDNVMDYWVNFNNTDVSPIENSANDGNLTIEHYAYANGDNSVSVEHYKVINGDHVWFDLNYNGRNTNQLIWDFVSRYDINGLR